MIKPRKRKITFIVVFFLTVVSLEASAQPALYKQPAVLSSVVEWKPAPWPVRSFQGAATVIVSHSYPSLLSYSIITQPEVQKVLSPDYYVLHFGFICKKEWEFEKSAHVPLRFRLGSLEYCNYLEGKK